MVFVPVALRQGVQQHLRERYEEVCHQPDVHDLEVGGGRQAVEGANEKGGEDKE